MYTYLVKTGPYIGWEHESLICQNCLEIGNDKWIEDGWRKMSQVLAPSTLMHPTNRNSDLKCLEIEKVLTKHCRTITHMHSAWHFAYSKYWSKSIRFVPSTIKF